MIATLQKHAFFKDKHIESCMLLEEQGYCNANYVVLANGVRYIARKLLRDDIDRSLEWRVQHLAYEQGITACPLVYEEAEQFMLMAFLEGEHRLNVEERDVVLLAQTLDKLHKIQLDTKPIALHIENKTKEVLQAYITIESNEKEYVLCHNDLNTKNILFSKEAKLIDWEYAGVNDRYFDLASICVEFSLDNTLKTVFLETYFEGSAFSLDKLEAYKVIYKTLVSEWFAHKT